MRSRRVSLTRYQTGLNRRGHFRTGGCIRPEAQELSWRKPDTSCLDDFELQASPQSREAGGYELTNGAARRGGGVLGDGEEKGQEGTRKMERQVRGQARTW